MRDAGLVKVRFGGRRYLNAESAIRFCKVNVIGEFAHAGCTCVGRRADCCLLRNWLEFPSQASYG